MQSSQTMQFLARWLPVSNMESRLTMVVFYLVELLQSVRQCHPRA